jgi:acyl dehydratase
MPIDPSAATGEWGDWTERSWTSKDALLYALGVGAGAEDPTGAELEFTTENSRGVDQKVLPTFAVIIGGAGGGARRVGSFNPAMLVDAGRKIELLKPIPVEGKIRSRGRLVGVYDKGSGALLASESESVDAETGEPLLRLASNAFIRGEGGFGGDRGPSGEENTPPDREPDHVVTYATRSDQALLYRLSGDRNPLHSDPEFAKSAGFPKPILHGLCTYGFTGRALLHALCGSDPSRFKSMEGRFSKPVFPGESLTVRMWVESNRAVFTTESSSGQVVIDRGACEFLPA